MKDTAVFFFDTVTWFFTQPVKCCMTRLTACERQGNVKYCKKTLVENTDFNVLKFTIKVILSSSANVLKAL